MDERVVMPGMKSALARLFEPEADGSHPAYVTSFTLPGGGTLFEAGEPADRLFFVKAGRLGVVRREAGEEPEFLGVVRPGEPVGEMALMTGTHHTATVTALRDSELYAVDRETFLEIAQHDAQVMCELARLMISRARQPHGRSPGAGEPSVFAFAGVSASVRVRVLVDAIARAAEGRGFTVAVVGAEGATTGAETLSALEAAHDVVLFAAEANEGAWREACVRQSDRVFLVGDMAEAPPTNGALEAAKLLRKQGLMDLVLLRPGRWFLPRGSQAWIDAVAPSRIFHVRGRDLNDVARLARVVTATSVGLVLSGGGARAFAHVGAIRALREAGVPIDFVAGASMGAIVGGALAMGSSDAELEARIRQAFVENSPLDDIAFPMLALTAGKKVEERLETHFGDVEIPDLLIPFFCVSSDLTHGTTYVHDRGKLRHALRASASLPGLLPPVELDGMVLVDGAVTRNFPADLVRERHRGPVIGVDVTRALSLTPEQVKRPDFWPWMLSGAWRKGPPIVSVLMRAGTVMTAREIEAGKRAVDLYVAPRSGGVEIRDWKAFDPAVQAGYDAMTAALAGMDDALRARLGLAPTKKGPAHGPLSSSAKPMLQEA